VLQQRRPEDNPGARLDVADLVLADYLMSARAVVLNVLRKPALHFVLLGAVLFGGERLLAARAKGAPAVVRPEIVITAARIHQLEEDFRRQTGKSPTKEEHDALVRQEVDDQVLYQEARVLGLDRTDKSVRARLIDKMRSVSDDPSLDDEALLRAARAAGLDDDLVIKRILRENLRILLRSSPDGTPPSDVELEAYLARHRDEYMAPETVGFDHVFLSARAHGDGLERDALSLRARLVRARISPDGARELSDPFPLGLSVPARPRAVVARQFGSQFADAVDALAGGEWSSPVVSPFGMHLVWVRERTKPAVPPLNALRTKLAIAVLDERSTSHLRDALERLRALYTISVLE
jgi:parvulin-like peptidyl-prolyl isomerase